MTQTHPPRRIANTPFQVLFASLIGTTIEFRLLHLRHGGGLGVSEVVFPSTDPATGTLASLATFGVVFVTRPMAPALRTLW
jgi:hypothetical protein